MINRRVITFEGERAVCRSVVAFEDVKSNFRNPCLICLGHVKEAYLTLPGGSRHTRKHLQSHLRWRHLVFQQGNLRIPSQSKRHMGVGEIKRLLETTVCEQARRMRELEVRLGSHNNALQSYLLETVHICHLLSIFAEPATALHV